MKYMLSTQTHMPDEREKNALLIICFRIVWSGITSIIPEIRIQFQRALHMDKKKDTRKKYTKIFNISNIEINNGITS